MTYLARNKLLGKIVKSIDSLFSFFILMTIIGLVLFAGHAIFEMYKSVFELKIAEILYDVAIIIILVKAYKVLLFYMQSHHVSVKYILEISIIAPAVDLIFAAGKQTMALNILFAAFSLGTLIVYLLFYEKLCIIDGECLSEKPIGE